MNNALMFSSATDEWETPQALFDQLNAEFEFGWDLAASRENTKVPGRFFHKGYSAFDSAWTPNAGVYWCNPPYSRGLQAKFIAKAAEDTARYGSTVVMLLPARTDTKAFHAHIYDASQWSERPGVEIRFLPGRLKFGGATNSAPFPSMVVVFRP